MISLIATDQMYTTASPDYTTSQNMVAAYPRAKSTLLIVPPPREYFLSFCPGFRRTQFPVLLLNASFSGSRHVPAEFRNQVALSLHKSLLPKDTLSVDIYHVAGDIAIEM
jgi:hypothetical protein